MNFLTVSEECKSPFRSFFHYLFFVKNLQKASLARPHTFSVHWPFPHEMLQRIPEQQKKSENLISLLKSRKSHLITKVSFLGKCGLNHPFTIKFASEWHSPQKIHPFQYKMKFFIVLIESKINIIIIAIKKNLEQCFCGTHMTWEHVATLFSLYDKSLLNKFCWKDSTKTRLVGFINHDSRHPYDDHNNYQPFSLSMSFSSSLSLFSFFFPCLSFSI